MIRVHQSTPATGAVFWYNFKEFAKSYGWTVPRSSDGTTYNASGDQITSGGAGAGGFANNNAWFELVSPDGERAFSIQRGTTNLVARIKYSARNLFGGGSPSATRVSSATDEVVVRGGGTDAAPTFYTIHTTDGTYRMGVVLDDEVSSDKLGAGYFLSAFTYLTASDAFRTNFTLEPLHPDSYVECDSRSAPTVGDADPVTLAIGLGTGNSLAWSMVDTATSMASATITQSPLFAWFKYGYVGSAFVNYHALRLAANFGAGTTLSTRAGVGAYDGKHELFHVYVGRSNDAVASQIGLKGIWQYTRQKGFAGEWPDTINGTVAGEAYVYTGRAAANTNHFVLPWEANVAPVGTVVPTNYPGRDLVVSSTVPDTTPPVASGIDPVAGSSVSTLTPLEITLTDEAATGVAAAFVWVVYENGTTEVVWDGSAFTEGFANSERTAVVGPPTGHTYTIRRTGGWHQSFALRWSAVDFSGNVSA